MCMILYIRTLLIDMSIGSDIFAFNLHSNADNKELEHMIYLYICAELPCVAIRVH